MERLIESVRKYPCLWATTREDYKINEIKGAAWVNVIKECNIPNIKEAKSLWKKLRDGHRQSLNRRKITPGQPADQSKAWKYDKSMSFLLPYMTHRPRPSISTPELEQETSQHSQNTSEAVSIKVEEDEICLEIENADNEIRKRNSNDSLDTYFHNAKKANHLGTPQQCSPDTIKSFFNTMYEMCKNLPEQAQMRIQREVFNSVMQAREENASYSSNSVYNQNGGVPSRYSTPLSQQGSSHSTYSP